MIRISDLIDRQSAIKAINEIIAVTPTQIDTVSDCIDAVNSLPSAQPEDKCGECDAWNQYKNYTRQPEQRWIPVSERLPEDGTDILVTYVDEEETRIIPVNYGRGTWFDCIFDRALDSLKVTAWMPLPEPYWE